MKSALFVRGRGGLLLVAGLAGLLLAPPAAAADPLGRLFMTPDQRNRLEARRQSKLNEVVAAQTEAADVDEPVASNLTLQGQIVRSSGESIVFINGVPYAGRESPKGLQQMAGKKLGEIVIVPAEGAQPLQLKVGQSLDRNSLTVSDALRAGTITIDRPAPRGATRPRTAP